MRSLVTGAGGFVGLNVVEALLRRGDEVVALDASPLPPFALEQLEALGGGLVTVHADVCDAGRLQDAFRDHSPERVVHAAVITPGDEREQSEFDRIIDVNVKGAANVLRAAADAGVARVVYVSSGSAYGRTLRERDTVSEEMAAAPDTLYSSTKYAAECICARFREQRNLGVISVRVGSVFGPWERQSGVRDTLSLPFQMVSLARAGAEIRLPAREPRRDWIYSRDVAAGILRLLDADAPAHALYNLATGARACAIAMPWCEHIRSIWPESSCRVCESGELPNVGFLGDLDRALMHTGRLSSDTGYTPHFDVQTALCDYAAWLRVNKGFL